MSKKCEDCGKFMALTDLMPDEDEFDEELAYECGMTDDEYNDAIFDTEGKWSRFRYVQDQWECATCQSTEWHTEGKRYYYDYERNGYFEDVKPLTPKETIAQENRRLEKAGQQRMFGDKL